MDLSYQEEVVQDPFLFQVKNIKFQVCYNTSIYLFYLVTTRLYSKSPPPITQTATKQSESTSANTENLSLSGEPVNPMHGSNHWTFERILSVATLGTIGTAAVYPHAMVDFALGFIIPLHCHIGFGCIITDYLPARKFPIIYRFARGVLYASTALTMYGLYKYNTEDVGIIEGVKIIWAVKKIKQTEESDK